MKRIHFFGDSHTTMYNQLAKELPNEFTIHFLGASTAYGLISDHSITRSFQQIQEITKDLDPDRDLIMFAFGEIDCRMLIYFKHMQNSIDLLDMIDVVLDRYFPAISSVRKKGFEMAIHGIIPAVRQETAGNLKFYGDEKTRASISFNFNEKLRERCLKEGMKYFDTYKLPYLLEGETLLIPRANLKSDMMHVNPGIVPIVEDFKKWLKESGLL
jgi:hypothetical protein